MKRIKILSVIMLILLMINCFCTSAFAGSAVSGGGGSSSGGGGSVMTFTAGDVQDTLAATVKIPVQVTNNSGFAGFVMEVNYDSTLLKPKSVSKKAVLNGQLTANLNYGDGAIKLAYSSQQNVTVNGEILYIEFNVLSDKDFTACIDISVSDVADADFNELYATGVSGKITMIKNFCPIAADIQSTFYNGDTWGITTSWENKSSKARENVRLYIATYRENGSLIERIESYYDFLAYERISFDSLLNNEDIYTIKLMAWTENMQPCSDVFEQIYKKAVISQYSLAVEEDLVKYTMIIDKFDYSGDDELQLYVTAYDGAKNLGTTKHDVTFTGTYATVEGYAPRAASSLKCHLWTKETLSPVDTKTIALNKVNVTELYCTTDGESVSYNIDFERFTAYEDETFDVYIAGYNSDNKLVSSAKRTLTFEGETAYMWGSFSNSDITTVRCHVWQKNTMKPVTDSTEAGVY